jgi:hypothetical protein
MFFLRVRDMFHIRADLYRVISFLESRWQDNSFMTPRHELQICSLVCFETRWHTLSWFIITVKKCNIDSEVWMLVQAQVFPPRLHECLIRSTDAIRGRPLKAVQCDKYLRLRDSKWNTWKHRLWFRILELWVHVRDPCYLCVTSNFMDYVYSWGIHSGLSQFCLC